MSSKKIDGTEAEGGVIGLFVGIAIVVIIALDMALPVIDIVALRGASPATGVLTFTDDVGNGDTVTIGDYVFEFTINGTVAEGHIPVQAMSISDDVIDQSHAIINLTNAINTNIPALVSATNG